ncbi:MAG TPA: NADPH:quinone oxidoreductase family protein [Nevskiaceae bacterium]|nr:NADPH:quinone oxidoreductase family protein [Nevskiaceae bacterium]
MKAIVCAAFGPPESLQLQDLPGRSPGPGEVRIAVEAAGVNFPDTLIIQDKYQLKAKPPFIPGAEVAGTVMEVGARVSSLRAGDRVMALVSVGGYASEAVAPAELCLKVPASMSAPVAAGFPLVYGTVIHALEQRGQLRPGETLLVLGAAGGVGLAAVQLGKLMGARVIAAASSEEKLALCRAQGADETINYRSESLKEAVKKLTRGQGADVIFDPVGGDLAGECFSCINWNGRYLVIGFADGQIPSLALNRLLLKGAAAVGVFWGAFIVREPAVQAANMRRLFDWFEAGQLKPHISREYPLEQAPLALRDMLERRVTGKVVLVT